MYSRIISGIDSHRIRYSCATSASLLVKWFLSWRPAAVRATGLYDVLTSTSDNAFRNSGKFDAAACSKYVFAANSSFLSVNGQKAEKGEKKKSDMYQQRNSSIIIKFDRRQRTKMSVRNADENQNVSLFFISQLFNYHLFELNHNIICLCRSINEKWLRASDISAIVG